MFKLSGVLAQFLHMHLSSQNRPTVKHSQYIFKHLLLLHLHVKFWTEVDFCLITVKFESLAIVDCFIMVFLPRPLVRLFDEDGETCEPLIVSFNMESFLSSSFSANYTLFCLFISAFLSLFLGFSWWVFSLNYPVSSLSILKLTKID